MIVLRRPPGQFARVGHRGASALAPDNSVRALELAVELGCDMIEFDVLPVGGRVLLLHDRRSLTADAATLDEALAFCAERLPGVGLQVDLKRRGLEQTVVDALRRHDLLDRSWVSGFDAVSLRRVAEVEPDVPRSYTLRRDRVGVARRTLPRRLPALLERARAQAVTLHYTLASAAAIAQAHELGAAVYVWTVDDPRLAGRIVRDGADGIITNDPRIFAELTT